MTILGREYNYGHSHDHGEITRQVVAAVLTNRSQIALFQRSQHVQGDRGLWHCITGFLAPFIEPEGQARAEISEESGIGCDLLALVGSSRCVIQDQHGRPWTVHAFHFESLTRDIRTNWENAGARWIHLDDTGLLPTVAWLPSVLSQLCIDDYVELQEADDLSVWAPSFDIPCVEAGYGPCLPEANGDPPFPVA